MENYTKTILVIEDEAMLAQIIREILVEQGFNVMVAQCISMAEAVIDSTDFIISDLNIGAENGLDFISGLRGQGCNIPCVIMSGFATEQDNNLALRYTNREILPKPFDLMQLSTLLMEEFHSCLIR